MTAIGRIPRARSDNAAQRFYGITGSNLVLYRCRDGFPSKLTKCTRLHPQHSVVRSRPLLRPVQDADAQIASPRTVSTTTGVSVRGLSGELSLACPGRAHGG